MASISEPFIRRPVGTTLLAIGLFLIGIVAYVFLPVSAVPNVDFPMIRVSAIAAGRRSVGDGGDGRRAAGAPARRDRRDRADHLDQFARHHQHSAAICHRPQHRPRRARRAGGDQRLAGRSAERPAAIAEIPQSQPGGGTGVRTGADIEDHLDQRDVRCRRYRAGAAHLAGTGGRRSHRQRRRPAGGADFAQSGGAVECGNRDRRRPARHHQRQSAGAGRHLQWRPAERDAVDQPADAHRSRIPRHPDQELERQFRSSLRCRRSRRQRAQQPLDRLVQQATGGADPDHQAGRCQRHRYRRPGESAAAGAEGMDSRRNRDFDAGRPHRNHPRQRAGHAAHAAGDRGAGHGGGVRVPAPGHADDCRRRLGAAGAGRHLRRDVARRFLDRQSVADGAGDFGRLRGRRRHRHDREHVPQSRARHGALSGGAGRRQADRLHRALDQPVADRRVHAADLHGRHCRPAVARIFADPDLRDRGFHGGVADGDADDLRALHQGSHFRPCDLVRSPGRRHAVAHRRVLYTDAARRARLSRS